jgi:indolepyruvate ferredoxin oxidoreductase, alpha subunit
MSHLTDEKGGNILLMMGNEAIARGALEAGVQVAAAYPGTPSSEIIDNLGKVSSEMNLYVEWSVNEKVAVEVAAAASFAGLRSLVAMKQNGVNVASDFLLHLALSGTRGGMVLIPCDDPGALSSVNEGESRHFAKLLELPLLEPGDFQEAKDMTRWAFELSEELKGLVVMRSVTRLSHASGTVKTGDLPAGKKKAHFRYDDFLVDQETGPVHTMPVAFWHPHQQAKLKKAEAIFEESPFNTYTGPEKPELLIITSSACTFYAKEAVNVLGAGGRVGILKLGTTWPLPRNLMKKHLALADRVFIIEEVLPFLEDNVKIMAAELAQEVGIKQFFGRAEATLPTTGELNPDIVIAALAGLLGIEYRAVPMEYEINANLLSFSNAPNREMTFCAGCPHRASFWNIHNALILDNRQGFVCGDIGCYTLAFLPCGFSTLKTGHCMGAGTGLASGFGKLGNFGMDQPVLSVCGDSTFYHAAMPALVNAVHNRSDIIMVILDNSGTAMTGFQPHPGLTDSVMGNDVPAVDIAAVCRAIGAKVFISDPFDVEATEAALLDLLRNETGTRVMILRQKCALSPERKGKKYFEVIIDESICLGEKCGCNRLCTRVFRCPGLIWDTVSGKARIDEVICAGCGVCASICPSGAIRKAEVKI